MINFNEIYQRQKDFQKHFYDPDNLSEKDKVYYTKEFLLALHRELGEALNCINWKIHTITNTPMQYDEFIVELIDSFKYLLNLFIVWNVSPEEFKSIFDKKSDIVEERFAKENKKYTK